MPTPTSQTEPFITVATLSRILGVPRSWVYQRTATGEIPHYRVGRYVRFRVSEVEAWLSQERAARGAHGR